MTAKRPYTILGVLALSNLAGYAARNSLFATYDDLRAKYHLPAHEDRATLGLLATAFLVPHALATLPFGWSGDRYQRRRVIALGLVLAAIAGAAGAYANSIAALAVTRVVVGFGTAAVVPIGNSIIAQVFDGPKKASRMSVFNLGVFFGGVAGLGIGAAVGFPEVAIVIAVPTVALAVWVWRLDVPPHPAPQPALPLARYLVDLGRLFTSESRVLLKIRTVRWLMLSTTAMAFAAGGYIAWLIDFLEKSKGMSEASATLLLSVSGVGAIAGILIGAWLADRLRARSAAGRMWTMALGMTGAVPCAAACILLPAGAALYASSLAMMFFFSWYHAPVAVTVDDLAPAARRAAAQGLVIGAMHLVGTAPSSYVVGVVADRWSLDTAMWVPTVALVVAAAAMAAATPSFARDHQLARGAITTA